MSGPLPRRPRIPLCRSTRLGRWSFSGGGVRARWRSPRIARLVRCRVSVRSSTVGAALTVAVVVACLDSEAKVKVGEPHEVWVDATKLHFFDADSGENLSAA